MSLSINNILVSTGWLEHLEAALVGCQLSSVDLTGCDLGIDASLVEESSQNPSSQGEIRLAAHHILSSGISASASLTHMVLDFCNLGDDGVRTLFEGVARSVSLEVLSLKGNSVGTGGAEAIGSALGVLQPGTSWILAELHLGSNVLGDEVAEYIALALQSGNCPLRRLHMPANNIGDEG